VTAGTLQVGDGTTSNLTGTSGVTISSGATLALNLTNGDTFSAPIKNSGHLTSNPTAGSNTISSAVNGTGNFIKNGAGTTTLTGVNSYTGGTVINAGKLLVNNPSGSGTGTGAVTVNGSGTLGGSGTITGAVTLNNGGFVAPGAGSPGVAGTTLHATSMMWNAGGTLSLQLGPTGDELVLTGALTKGGAGSYTLNLIDTGITQSSYTLATFSSTTFAPANFTLNLPAGYTGSLVETSTSLILNLGHGSQPADTTSGGTLTVNDSHTSPSTTTLDSSSVMLTSSAFMHSSDILVQSDSIPLTLTPTPEPGSVALLALGAGALLGRRKRRRA
ncbi:MAG: autotransporter-associated beta strand repeat-containing protein, partial [Chthoniobacter sp.]